MTTFTNEVRRTVSPYKFGGSRRAAAAYLVSLDGGLDDEAGSADGPFGWIGRIGRTILEEDGQGFVSCERFKRESLAIAYFDAVQRAHDEGARQDDPEDQTAAPLARLDETSAELLHQLRARVGVALGQDEAMVACVDDAGGLKRIEVDLGVNGIDRSRMMVLTRWDPQSWQLGFYDYSDNAGDLGVVVTLHLMDNDDPREVARAVAGIVSRMGLTWKKA